MPQSRVPFTTWRLSNEPQSLAYDLLSNLIIPRPIAFVSTISNSGVPNLAPFSFFMLGGVDPPSLAFCPVRTKDGRKKVSLINIEETGEFVANLVTRDMAERMNSTGIDYPEGYEKWGLSGFTPLKSDEIKPARVLESPVQLECRVHQVVEHGTSSYVIAEVLVAHVAHDSNFTSFEPIARLGGAKYIDLNGGKVFEMDRPELRVDPSV